MGGHGSSRRDFVRLSSGVRPGRAASGNRGTLAAEAGHEFANAYHQCPEHSRRGRRRLQRDIHRQARIAVLAAGYGDGIHRSLGNRGSVLVRGALAPIVGIISMDVTMIDVTDVPGIEIGDVVTIYGSDGEQVHPANAVARSIGTVTSDLLCAVAQRVPRIYVS